MQEPAKRFIYRMKKLFLTSYSFKGADGNTYKDYKLVMVQSNEIPEGKEHEDVAYTKMKRWFPENHGPETELLSIIAHHTITGYAEDNIIMNQNKEAFAPVDNPVRGFDASWNNGDVLPCRVLSAGGYEDYTDDMLIDIDGNRKHFVIGWYDFKYKAWKTGNNDTIESTMKWKALPFAKYDKN